MKTSVILVMLLIFVSIDYISSDELKYKQLCDVFKPKGIFSGVKAYKNVPSSKYSLYYDFEYTTRMYANGMEWVFLVRNGRIIFLEETLTSIQPEFNDSVIFRVNIPISEYRVYDCWLIRSQTTNEIKRKCYFEDKLEVDGTTKSNFDSMIAYNMLSIQDISFKDSLGVGLIDRNHCSNQFYSINKDNFTKDNRCWPPPNNNPKRDQCLIPEFIEDIPYYWRSRLDAIIELHMDWYNDGTWYWLILLNNNSQPLFCITGWSDSFAKGCSDDKLKTYGDECPDGPFEEDITTTQEDTTEEPTDTTTEETTTIEETTHTTLEETTVTTPEPTSEKGPGIDWLPTIGISIGLTTILSMVITGIFLIWYFNKSDQNDADIDSFLKVEPKNRNERNRQKLLKKYESLLESGDKGVHRLTQNKGMADNTTELQ